MNNPLLFTDPNGLQAGTWYEADDGVSPHIYHYPWNKLPRGYSELTRRNKWGELISDPTNKTHVFRFNPNGPAANLIDPLLNGLKALTYSDYDFKGYDFITSDWYEDTFLEHPSDGYVRGSQNVTLDLVLAFQGSGKVLSSLGKGVIGKAAMETAVTTERSAVVSENGLNIVKSHLAQFGDDAGNTGMVQRLENAMANGRRVTGADRNFYMHELKEATLMGRGMTDEAAHKAALVWDRANPFSIYHPEVIKQYPSIFSPNFLKYWEAKPK